MKRVLSAITMIVSLGLGLLILPSCGDLAKEAFRAPVLSDGNWQSLVPIKGDFPPTGGSFDTDFDGDRFHGYRYSAPAGARVTVTVRLLSGRADPVLVMYGPQSDTGAWNGPAAIDDDSLGDRLPRLAPDPLEAGIYLFVVSVRSFPSAGGYRITLNCVEGCDEPTLCPLVPNCPDVDICHTGWELDDEGCPTCACNDECRVDRECGPEEICERGECVEECVCNDPLDPVCGSDGLTYSNACEAACVGVTVIADRPCRTECDPLECNLTCPSGYVRDDDGCRICECLLPCERCDRLVQPVCSQSGLTFPNVCLAACEGETVAYAGACRPDCEALFCEVDCPGGLARDDSGCPVCECIDSGCPTELDPVCGNDGVTYDNACQAELAGAMVLFESTCPPPCRGDEQCPDGYVCRNGTAGLPACSASDLTCPSACVLIPDNDTPCDTARQCVLGDTCSADGHCVSRCDCSPVYNPVCGLDGRTYGNACRARCADAVVDFVGECCEASLVDQCELDCPDGYAVDTRGCSQCACAEPTACVCDNIENPICGEDGVRYRNACVMRCAGVAAATDPARCLDGG